MNNFSNEQKGFFGSDSNGKNGGESLGKKYVPETDNYNNVGNKMSTNENLDSKVSIDLSGLYASDEEIEKYKTKDGSIIAFYCDDMEKEYGDLIAKVEEPKIEQISKKAGKDGWYPVKVSINNKDQDSEQKENAYSSMLKFVMKNNIIVMDKEIFIYNKIYYELCSEQKLENLIMDDLKDKVSKVGSPSFVGNIIKFIKMYPDMGISPILCKLQNDNII